MHVVQKSLHLMKNDYDTRELSTHWKNTVPTVKYASTKN